MSAISLAKQAFSALNHEKPHSSITDWIEILTGPNIDDEAYDGIPEILDSINLQPTGPAEASRAIRKKLKHGDSHRQYRALVILKALVENGGTRFQTSFADSQLTDAIKHMSSDPTLDPKIKRKLTSVLASWYRQFKSDPKMTLVANLYKTTKDENGQTLWAGSDAVKAHGAREREKEVARERERVEQREREVREKEEAKRRAKEVKAAEKAAKEAEAQKARQPVRPRKRFDYVKEKPVVLQSIVEASQAASNLVNALKLVHRPEEKVQDDARTQECLNQAKQVRKQIIRYIQLVEDEEVIGTLIESNERIIAALETYDQYCTEPVPEEESVPDNASVSVSSLSLHESEVQKLQAKQRGRVAESIRRGKGGSVHPDLQDLNFGELGASSSALPAPLRPTGPESPQASFRGSLSDFSDYNSSDEETHDRRSESPYASGHYSGHQGGGGGGGGGGGRPYGRYEESTSEVDVRGNARQGLLDEDPFADPFADQQEVTTPGITERKPLGW